jgi:hypothetical protein
MAVSHGTKHSAFLLFLCALTGAIVYTSVSCASAGALGGGPPARQEAEPAEKSSGGDTPPKAERDAVRRALSRTEPAEKPAWVDTAPKSAGELYFVGVSRAYSSAADARNAAREDAFNQVLKYYGEYIQASSVEKTTVTGNTSDTLNSYLEKEEDITRFAQAVVSQVGTDRYYTEVYTSGTTEEYIVYVLCQIPKAKAEADIANFSKNISERYGGLLAGQPTLIGALKVYSDTAGILRQNPLHRTVAYYDSPNGRVALYEYCIVQINALSNSVSFTAIPVQAVRKGESLNAAVKLSSTLYRNIGPALCKVDIAGSAAPTVRYSLDADNSFLLQIHTAKLDPGSYNVHLELLLNDTVSPPRNPASGFSFEVTPVSAVIEFSGSALTQAEQNTLAQGVLLALQRYTVSLQNGSVFVISFVTKDQEGAFAGSPLSVSETSISLLKNGEILCQSELKRITEIDKNRALRLAADFYQNNNTFWTQVKNKLEN